MKLPGLERLVGVGWVGERKALALLCLAFYATLFFLVGLSARTELPEWVPLFFGMMAVYLIGFIAVAAEWFWGRWFATGLGYWGVTMAGWAFLGTRSLPPAMVIFGTMHALISLCLSGERMAAAYDAKPGWRERYKIDEQGVLRVRKAVTRAATSLPAMVLFALAPREGAALALVGLVVFGLFGVLQLRTWGVLVLGAAGMASVGIALSAPPAPLVSPLATGLFGRGLMPLVETPALMVGFAGAMLCAAAVPFMAPAVRFLRHR
jgi:hypothetical protein